MKVGFVGVGNMGGPMVLNLLKAGHQVVAYDLSPTALERVAAAGAAAAGSPKALTETTEMVLTSLPTPAAVEAVYLGPDGLLEGARPDQLFFDLSSISPSLARSLAERFAAKGAVVLDAPVSGGTTGAQAGTLAIMVGGAPEAFRRGEAVLGAIGKNVFHVGEVGSSSTIKMLNQLLVGITNIAVVEMVNLARRAGADMVLVREVIGASSGYSRIFEGEYPRAVDRDFAPGFAIDLMAKDLRIVRDLAKEVDTELPMAQLALTVFEKASRQGLGLQDVSGVLQLYEDGRE